MKLTGSDRPVFMEHNTVDNNMQSNFYDLKKLPKNTYEITVTIPWTEINSAKEKAVAELASKTELDGFRKGKAPGGLVKDKIDPQQLLSTTLENIVPEYYKKAIEQTSLKPITNPKVELVSSEDNKDWVFKFTTCEMPEINLGDYKTDLKKTISEVKIWTPGKTDKPDQKAEQEQKDKKIGQTLVWLNNNIKIEISDLLLEEEVNHKLSKLLEQTQKLGLTIDQYLNSTGKTVDQIKQEFLQESEKSLKTEFILSKIAETEKITVSPEDIQKAIDNSADEEEKKQLENQKYLLAILLRQQKTLDFLLNL